MPRLPCLWFLLQPSPASWPVKTGHPGHVGQIYRNTRDPLCKIEQHELDGLFLQAMTGGGMCILKA
jgi:hypothetical protein